MFDVAVNLFIYTFCIAILVIALKAFRLIDINLRWVAVSAVLFYLNYLSLSFGRDILPLDKYFQNLDWNWAGKILAITSTIASLALLFKLNRNFSLKDAGFTFLQNEASLKPAVLVILGVMAFHVSIKVLIGGGSSYDAEDLLYQASMPGIDEEPMYRGVFLYALSLGLIAKRFNVLGAHINVAGLVVTCLFGLIHGVFFRDNAVSFEFLYILWTGFYGFVLLWLRERTGSLLMPIFLHNLLNFVGLFL